MSVCKYSSAIEAAILSVSPSILALRRSSIAARRLASSVVASIGFISAATSFAEVGSGVPSASAFVGERRRSSRRLGAAGIRRVKGVKKLGMRLGNWLTAEQGHALWQSPDRQRLKGKRDRALLALLLACGLRRHEAVALTLDHLQQREEHWAIVDLVGKGGHIRTVPVPDWVRTELDDWLAAAAIDRGKLFRRVNKVGRAWGDGMTVKAVWHIVKESARHIGVARLAPHDLRRTCARLCHASGGELEQIQFLLGHVSVQTTERYLGCKQRIRSAVNDRIGIEPNR